jgi:hypothetical protein
VLEKLIKDEEFALDTYSITEAYMILWGLFDLLIHKIYFLRSERQKSMERCATFCLRFHLPNAILFIEKHNLHSLFMKSLKAVFDYDHAFSTETGNTTGLQYLLKRSDHIDVSYNLV